MADDFYVELQEELSYLEYLELGALHCDTLPLSVPALLGARYAGEFYKAAIRSDTEFIVIARKNEGTIVGSALVSLSPSDLPSRMLKLTTNNFVICALKTLIGRNQSKRTALFKTILSPSTTHKLPKPLLIYLFVGETHRGKGVGKAILQVLDGVAATAGFTNLHVMTEDNSKNVALGFYSKNGFVGREKFNLRGQGFMVLDRVNTSGKKQLNQSIKTN